MFFVQLIEIVLNRKQKPGKRFLHHFDAYFFSCPYSRKITIPFICKRKVNQEVTIVWLFNVNADKKKSTRGG